MKIRFFAALLVAALSISLMGCAVPEQLPIAQKNLPESSAVFIPEAEVPAAPGISPATEPVLSAPALTLISKDDAIGIALKDAGFTADQVTRLRAEFDYDDGRPEYDVEFHQGGYEYDYEIHAESGNILSRDKDRED